MGVKYCPGDEKQGVIRICVDYRDLNREAVEDRYPLPRLEDILSAPAGCQYMTMLDLPMGFNQLPLQPADRHKFAFITPFGLYIPDRLQFELRFYD